VSEDTLVNMYRLGQGVTVNPRRQEYVYDFVPKTDTIPPEVEQQIELQAEIARGR
jgi:hypothetical protein